jgi:hypothetical protein
MSNQARDYHGRWTAGAAEQSMRDAGRHAVAAHGGTPSVGSHTGSADITSKSLARGLHADFSNVLHRGGSVDRDRAHEVSAYLYDRSQRGK